MSRDLEAGFGTPPTPEDITLRLEADGEALRVVFSSDRWQGAEPLHLEADSWRGLDGAPLDRRRGERRPMECGPAAARPPDGALRPFLPVEPVAEAVDFEQLGIALFEALFPPKLRRKLERARARSSRVRLGLLLDLSDPRVAPLHRLPWELLHEPEALDFLTLDRRLTFAREVASNAESREPARGQSLRILPVLSQPDGPRPLALEEELRALREKALSNPAYEILEPVKEPDLLKVRRRILDDEAHVLHFMGHGDLGPGGHGRLIFERPDRQPLPVDARTLAQELRDLSGLRLAFLNACRSAEIRSEPFSGVATALLQAGVPAVIAMQRPISDERAVAFSSTLYERLACDEPLDLAVSEARRSMRSPQSRENDPEWATPVLFARSKSDPLFERRSKARTSARAQAIRKVEKSYLEILAQDLERTDPGAALAPLLGVPLRGLYCFFERDSLPTERIASGRLASSEPADTSRACGSDLASGTSSSAMAPGDEDESDAPRPLTWIDVLRHPDNIVLQGEPMAGKSHVLRWTTLDLARSALRGERRWKVRRRCLDPRGGEEIVDVSPVLVPILLDVADFARARHRRPGLRFADYLGSHLRQGSGPDGRAIDRAAIRSLLLGKIAMGDAILLFDGLDRVDSSLEKTAILEGLAVFLETGSSSAGKPCRTIWVGDATGVVASALERRASVYRVLPVERSGLERLFAHLGPSSRPGDPESAREAGFRAFFEVLSSRRRQASGFRLGWAVMAARLMASLDPAGLQRGCELARRIVEILDRLCKGATAGEDAADASAERWRALLPKLAAAALDRALPKIERRWLLDWLGQQSLDGDVLDLERGLRKAAGPLLLRESRVYSFLDPWVLEALAADRILSEAGKASLQIEQRLGSPPWRPALALAAGWLSERLPTDSLEQLLNPWLEPGDGGPITPTPAGLLVALEALPELAEAPRSFLEALVGALIASAGSESIAAEAPEHAPCLSDDREGSLSWAFFARRALIALSRGNHGYRVQRALATRLRAERAPSTLVALAEMVSEGLLLEARGVKCLEGMRHLDRAPWPIERALRVLATRDPLCLSSPRGSLRRAFRRELELAGRLRTQPAWRRVVLALFGGEPHFPFLSHSTLPLEARLTRALREGRGPGEVLDRASASFTGIQAEDRKQRAVLRLGTWVLGRSLQNPLAAGSAAEDLDHVASLLDRSLAGRPEKVRASQDLAEALSVLARTLRPRLFLDAFKTILHHIEPRARLDLAIQLAVKSAPDVRPLALSIALMEWSLERSVEERELAEFRLAVFLDTRGSLLTEPIDVLIDTLGLMAREDLPPPVEVGSSTPENLRLALALDSIRSLPSSLDGFRAFALIVLAPRLRALDFETEAGLLVELALPERVDLRKRARAAFAEPGEAGSLAGLQERARTLEDPWLLFRALWLQAWYRVLPSHRVESSEPHRAHAAAELYELCLEIADPLQRVWALETLSRSPSTTCAEDWARRIFTHAAEISEVAARVRLEVRHLVQTGQSDPAWWTPLQRELRAVERPEARAALQRWWPRSLPIPDDEAYESVDLRLWARHRLGSLLLRHEIDGGKEGDLLLLRILLDEIRDRQGDRSCSRPAPAGLSSCVPGPARNPTRSSRRMTGGLEVRRLERWIANLEEDDDLVRLQAAGELHGRYRQARPWRRTLLSERGCLDRLAHHWLDFHRHDPRRADVIRWAFATWIHDDPSLFDRLLTDMEYPGPRAECGRAVLLFLEALDSRALPGLRRLLAEGGPEARRSTIRGLATVLGRNRGIERWWPVLAPMLPPTAEAFGTASFDLRGPLALVEAAEAAFRSGADPGTIGAQTARERFVSGRQRWSELLCEPESKLLTLLQRLGQRRFDGEASRAGAGEAASRLAAQPQLLPILLEWLKLRWHREVPRFDPDDRELDDLLRIVEAFARERPRTFQEATTDRTWWPRLLRDIAVDADWFPSRRSAIVLASLGQRIDEPALEVLRAALDDVPEVAGAAVHSLHRFLQFEEPGLVERLLGGLSSRKPLYAWACARLLGQLANGPSGPSPLIPEVDRALQKARRAPQARRWAYLAASRRGKGPLLERLGRLDQLFQSVHCKLHGASGVLERIRAKESIHEE